MVAGPTRTRLQLTEGDLAWTQSAEAQGRRWSSTWPEAPGSDPRPPRRSSKVDLTTLRAVINFRRSTAVLLGLLATTALAGPAPAQADEEPAPEPPRVELVLDVSGSMRAADIDGAARISVAQQAFNEVVDALPEETQLGIRVLGATYRGKDKKVGCQDTQQICRSARWTAPQAKAAVATLRPTGFTPVGLALRSAARGPGHAAATTRRIVLITDGEDTCAPPDPCEVARELAAQGTSLVVDTLGLAPDEKVRRQLLCIASATGGTYTAAQSAEELTGRIKQLVERAADTHTRCPDRGRRHERVRLGAAARPRRLRRPGGVLRAPLLPGAGTPRAGAARLGEHGAGPAASTGTTGCCCGPPPPTAGNWSAARTPAAGGPTCSPPGCAGRPPPTTRMPRRPSESSAPVVEPTTVCLVVSNSFAPRPGTAATPGMPVELTIDVVAAAPGTGRPGPRPGLGAARPAHRRRAAHRSARRAAHPLVGRHLEGELMRTALIRSLAALLAAGGAALLPADGRRRPEPRPRAPRR